MDFPLITPLQNAFGGYFDAFVAILGVNASSLDFATYLGGGGDDRAYGVAPLGTTAFVFGGQFMSGTVSSAQPLYGTTTTGQYDGFLAAISLPQPLRFIPITPCRVADTRNANGPFGGPAITAGTSRDFVIPSSACGIPSNAQAYSFNVAAVPTGVLHYITVWPSGQSQPLVATLNSPNGTVKSSGAIIPAGTSGAISVYVTDTTQIILDINGYFVPATNPSALAFYPIVPCRIADTRNSTGPLGGPSLTAQQSRTFPILASACNIPSSAQAYAFNLTAVPSNPVGFLTAWPTGQAMPLAATLNVPTPVATGNAAILAAGTNGSIDVFAAGTTDLVIDINGYFAAPGSGGLSLYSVTPCRVLDTRQLSGSLPVTGTISINPATTSCAIPSAAEAYVFNVTAVPPPDVGYLTLWPQGQTQPLTSMLNWNNGVTNNLAIVPAAASLINAFTSNSTHLVFDVFGFFAP
jgi:hypothetical protein